MPRQARLSPRRAGATSSGGSCIRRDVSMKDCGFGKTPISMFVTSSCVSGAILATGRLLMIKNHRCSASTQMKNFSFGGDMAAHQR